MRWEWLLVPLLLWLFSRSVMSDSLRPHGLCSQALLSMGFNKQEDRVGCHFLLQEIFPTRGLKPSLLHCRRTLPLSHQRRLYFTDKGAKVPLVTHSSPSASERQSRDSDVDSVALESVLFTVGNPPPAPQPKSRRPLGRAQHTVGAQKVCVSLNKVSGNWIY